MPAIKLNISLDEKVAVTLRRFAVEDRKPASRILAELIRAEEKRRLDELAEEGYRLLDEDTRKFVDDTWPTAAEGWPDWKDGPDEQTPTR